jgi:hypothetical protein
VTKESHLTPAEEARYREVGEQFFREEGERKARLARAFPGFLGESLAENRLLVLAVLVGPWVLFWTAPIRTHRQLWLIPHIGPVPHLVRLWASPNWLPVVGLPLVALLVALLFVVVFPVSLWPTRNVRASAYNVLAFAGIFAALVGFFATIYLQLAHNYPSCFNHRLTHVEALYFTITTFTTTGFGDIIPKSPGCRLIVAFQSLVGLVVITLAIAALAARLLRGGQSA